MQRKAMRRAVQVASLLRHPIGYVRLRRTIARARRAGIAADDSRIPVKYLGAYLSAAIDTYGRLCATWCHYDYLLPRIGDGPGSRAWRDGFAVWKHDDAAGRQHRIVLQSAHFAPMEGEAELLFSLDGRTLCAITFAIVDRRLIGENGDGAIVFVGGIQGGYWVREEMRYAARESGEIAPLAMLLLGLRALADVFGIDAVAGTSTEHQVAKDYQVDGRSMTLDYDDFWLRANGVRNARGFFVVRADNANDADDPVTGNHRARTRRRRRLKAERCAAMAAVMRERLNL